MTVTFNFGQAPFAFDLLKASESPFCAPRLPSRKLFAFSGSPGDGIASSGDDSEYSSDGDEFFSTTHVGFLEEADEDEEDNEEGEVDEDEEEDEGESDFGSDD